MTFKQAIQKLPRDERFKATISVMNTLLLKLGVYKQREFEEYFLQWARSKTKHKPRRMRASTSIKMSRRIKKLRASLGMNQTEFGKRLGVGQTAVSQWEIGADRPSAEVLLCLGNIAYYPDSICFWKAAGLDINAMILASQEIVRSRAGKKARRTATRGPRSAQDAPV